MTDRVLQPTEEGIGIAAERIRSGGLVGMPTETVYGLAADAGDERAVGRIFATKNRPADNPLIVHVADVEQARPLVDAWSDTCDDLAGRFWPGPLTLVLRRSGQVGDLVTAGHDTVALRSPDHPVASGLIRATGRPIVAPSANRSGHVSPTDAAHVLQEFPDEDFPVLDGGPCVHGIESTIVAIDDDVPFVLRPGAITLSALREVLGRVEAPVIGEQGAAPGTALHHYAPVTPATLVRTDELDELLAESEVPVVVLSIGPREADPPHSVIEMPEDAEGYARVLYRTFREADALRASVLIVEMPPLAGGLWRAVNDRLRRACVLRD
ncbi:MAG: threonylcarbamoyl-AMP synthase [Phycisphaerales bacterium]|nr:threonylcarbamoyl-AMP synthase [Phycisphaerales bacterium]